MHMQARGKEGAGWLLAPVIRDRTREVGSRRVWDCFAAVESTTDEIDAS